MIQNKKYKVLCLSFLIFLTMCAKFDEINSVEPPQVETGTINRTTLTIQGQIKSTGDGIIEYGHLFSLDNNPIYKESESTRNGKKNSVCSFTSNIPLNDFPGAENIFIRGYAVDVYDRIFYDDAKKFENVIANFSFDPFTYFSLDTVKFYNSSNLSGRAECLWNFGDGSTSDEENPSHIYFSPGNYTVTFTLTYDSLVNSIQKNILINGITFEKYYASYIEGIKVLNLLTGDFIVAGTEIIGSLRDIRLIRIDREGKAGSIGFDKKIDYDGTSEELGDIIEHNNKLLLAGSNYNSQHNGQDWFIEERNLETGEFDGRRNFSGLTNINHSVETILENNSDIILYGTLENKLDSYHKDLLFKRLNRYLTIQIETTIDIGDYENGYDIIMIDNGFIAVGEVDNQAFIMMLDSNGKLVGDVIKYGKTGFNAAYSITEIPESNNLLICGTTSNYGDNDILLLEVSRIGQILKEKIIDLRDNEAIYDMKVLQDGSIILAGTGSGAPFLVKVDKYYSREWDHIFVSNGNGYFNAIDITIDGGFVATGKKDGSMFIIKTDSKGNL